MEDIVGEMDPSDSDESFDYSEGEEETEEDGSYGCWWLVFY